MCTAKAAANAVVSGTAAISAAQPTIVATIGGHIVGTRATDPHAPPTAGSSTAKHVCRQFGEGKGGPPR